MCCLVLAAFLLAGLVPFEQGGKWGYKDASGKVVIPARFDVAQEFSPEGLAAVADAKGWVYIDTKGQPVIRPFVVDNGPDEFAEGLARFVVKGKFGFFDRRGKPVIRPQFTFALPFSEGRAGVCEGCKQVRQGEHTAIEGGKWGFIDRSGRLAIPLQFEEIRGFEKGRARVRTGSEWRTIDQTGAAR